MTNEHADGERAGSAPRTAIVVRADVSSAGPASPLAVLQRQVGNRAVVELLARPAASVQRDPGGLRGGEGPRLHLDPEIEAQIRAITAMHALLAPEPVRAGLLDLTLPQPPGQPASAS